MKQKNEDNEVVTRGILRLELQRELQKEIEKVKTEFKKDHNEVMTAIDGVMKELENMREDNLIGTYQIRELRDVSEDHEKRITKIEHKQKAT